MNAGFDVFCPNLIGRMPFRYEESQKAYEHFIEHTGFDVYQEICVLINQLKEKYERVIVIGFSIGATIAWRCCENVLCDGIVACYGSRIRDYTNLNPVCPTLLLFAKEGSVDIDSFFSQLQGKPLLVKLKFEADHGFLDPFSKCFNRQVSKCAEKFIFDFLAE